MFVESPAGGVDFGYLPEEAARFIRRQAGPIRLLESDLRHIEERHGDQIRKAGYDDIPTFLYGVCENFNTIYRGNIPGTLLLLDRKAGNLSKAAAVRLQLGEVDGQDYYAVKTAMLTAERYYKEEIPLLQRDAPIARSFLQRTPFGAGPEADVRSLVDGEPLVKVLQTHPPPSSSSPDHRSPFDTTQEQPAMAAQLDHLFSYGPLDVVASNDEKSPGLHIIHADVENNAFIPSGDPAHQEILTLIEKNPHSWGFVANQIQSRLEREGRWAGPALDDEGVSLGPSQEVAREEPAPERTPEELSAPSLDVPSAKDFDPVQFPDDVLKTEHLKLQDNQLPENIAEAAKYQEVVVRPLVLSQGSTIVLGEGKQIEPGDRFLGYSVGLKSEGLDPHGQVPHWHLRKRFPESGIVNDPVKAQEFKAQAMEYAAALAERPLTMESMIPGYDKMTLEEQKRMAMEKFPSAYRKEPDLTADWPGRAENPSRTDPANGKIPDVAQEPVVREPAIQEPASQPPEPEARVPRFPKKVPPEILMADSKRGKPLVLDHGDKVSVTNRAMVGLGRDAEERRNKAVEVGLKAAKERFGEPVRFSGSRAFEEKAIEAAVRLGIQLEPATEQGKRAYEKALEAKNTLGPAVNRAPGKTVQKEKSMGQSL